MPSAVQSEEISFDVVFVRIESERGRLLWEFPALRVVAAEGMSIDSIPSGRFSGSLKYGSINPVLLTPLGRRSLLPNNLHPPFVMDNPNRRVCTMAEGTG